MSGETPLVSVIIPVYNGQDYVADAIRSALLQTYRNIEVIVVDDGSTDDTAVVLQAQAALDPRVRIIRQANGGVARARNRGLAEARGEFVAPLDADDLWDPAKLARQVDRMIQAGPATGMVYCWWIWVDDQGRAMDRSPEWRIEGDVADILLQVNYTGNASVPLYRRRCLDEADGYDETFTRQNAGGCEDWDIALKVAERYGVAVVPELLVGYRRRRDSMSGCCDVMWRSQMLMMAAARKRRPGRAPEVFQRSADQFALCLAGISFWSGSYVRALGWTLRAWRSSLPFQLLPYAARLLVRRLPRNERASRPIMAPGQRLDSGRVAPPLIPYDRICGFRGTGVHQPATSPNPELTGPGSGVGPRIEACLRSRTWQIAAVVLTFLLVAGLHANNDGLWFRGDAARHATNGFFWWDLVKTLPADPIGYAVRYYARYPVISPVTYPPLFYLFEGLAYSIAGPTPLGPRLEVIAFAIMAGLYTMAWARRWINLAAGWAGAFLAFVPSVLVWSNALMLNVPAMALGLASLYHFRRWIESASRRQALLTAGFLAASLLTYYTEGSVICVCFGWALLTKNGRTFRRSLLWVAGVGLLAAIPLGLAMHTSPVQLARHLPGLSRLANWQSWTFYFRALPDLLGVLFLAAGCAGIGAALINARWRTEARYVLVWIATLILVFSLLPAKSPRYILLIAPAFLIGAVLGLASIALPRRPKWRAAMLIAGIAGGAWMAAFVHVPRVSGFQEVAVYLRQNAPADAVLYDGYDDGLFGFYTRAMDPRFERRIVLADQLLYHYGPTNTYAWTETAQVTSTEEVLKVLREKSGCRLIAVEIGVNSQWAKVQRLLRETVLRPEFELVRSFPVQASGADRVDLYRLKGRIEPVTTVDLSFPSYSDRVFPGVLPITR